MRPSSVLALTQLHHDTLRPYHRTTSALALELSPTDFDQTAPNTGLWLCPTSLTAPGRIIVYISVLTRRRGPD